MHYPLIERKPISNIPEIDLNDINALVFTSQFAVDIFTDFYGVIKNKIIYAIGPKTKERLIKRGYNNIILPEKFDSFSLVNLLDSSLKILYPCSSLSNNDITNLENVIKFPVYETIFKEQKRVRLEDFDGIYFASSSCVIAFLNIYKKIPEHFIIYTGGRTTFKKLMDYGYKERSIILEKSTFD
ncbi:MAG: uroporphyrinogen-III synthase [Brevinematia bacterium]